MADELAYPGLVGAGISRAQRSPYDRSMEPGEATTEDVRAGLLEMFLSGLGLVPGGVLAAQGPRTAGSRARPRPGRGYPAKLGVRVDFRESPEYAKIREWTGVPNTPLYDEMSGLNRGHAAWRARQNWESGDVLPLPELRIKGR
jgi:hypothetical protein